MRNTKMIPPIQICLTYPNYTYFFINNKNNILNFSSIIVKDKNMFVKILINDKIQPIRFYELLSLMKNKLQKYIRDKDYIYYVNNNSYDLNNIFNSNDINKMIINNTLYIKIYFFDIYQYKIYQNILVYINVNDDKEVIFTNDIIYLYTNNIYQCKISNNTFKKIISLHLESKNDLIKKYLESDLYLEKSYVESLYKEIVYNWMEIYFE